MRRQRTREERAIQALVLLVGLACLGMALWLTWRDWQATLPLPPVDPRTGAQLSGGERR